MHPETDVNGRFPGALLSNQDAGSRRTSDIILAAITAVVLVIVAYPLYCVLIAKWQQGYVGVPTW